MRQSESLFFELRGLRYHVRHWRGEPARRMFLLHGWMDVSASFQFLVDELAPDWDVYAPDWRGYGLTSWSGADSYWFPDYIADLDQLLDRIQSDAPVNLVGHSLGGNVAALYAGIRPERIARFVNLEGFGMPATRVEQAPKRYARWMEELRVEPRLRSYQSYAALADRFALKELKNGDLYYRVHAYDSAIIYYRSVVATYPDSKHVPAALLKLVETYRRIGYAEEAGETCEHLRRFFPTADGVARTCPAPAPAAG